MDRANRLGARSSRLSGLLLGRVLVAVENRFRQMVLRLGDALDVPLRERNHLLHAAGLPVAYPQVELRDRDLAPYLAAVDRLLQAHLPYPAMVLDPYGTVLLANRACHALFGADIVGANLTHRFLADPAARQAIANWPEVAWAGLDRLRHQLDRTPFDQQLGQLVDLAETTLAGVPRPHQPSTDPVVCPWFRIGDQIVKTVGIAARFESAAEITLDELRIELTYPLDADADVVPRNLLRAHEG